MGFFNAFVLFVVAALMALAALVQGIVALFEFLRQGRKLRIFMLFMAAFLLIAGLAGYGALLEFTHTATSSATQPSPSVIGIGNQASSPTDMVPPTDTSSPTNIAQPTDTPSAVPTLPPTPGPATKASVLPFIVNCECTSNPVQVRVTGVHIQSSLGLMTWDLTLLNVGTRQLDVKFNQFDLDLNEQSASAEGGIVDNRIPLAPNGQSEDIGQSTITFTFVPQQGTYMLKVIIDLCPGFCDTVSYKDNPFTFQ